MPVGYVVTAVVLAAATAGAVRPPRGPGRFATGAYLLAMVLNEVPLVFVGWAALVTALAHLEGDLATPGGFVGLALLAPTVVGLVHLALRGWRARGAPEQALRDALGPGWRDRIDPDLAAGLRTDVPLLRSFLAPLPRRRLDVERVRDLPYGDAGRRHRLDLYRHRSRPTGCPVLVHLHGGRFRTGAKSRESLPLLHHLASRGWVCVSANYRLAPAAGFDDHLVDVKRMLAWVRAEGAAYGADPGSVFVAGSSAGAHLAATAALTAGRPEWQPGFEAADTSVAGAVCLYGYYGRREADDPASTPHAHVGPHAPPFHLLHGDRDSVVPVAWGRALATDLRAASRQPVVWSELPGAQHTFDYVHSVRTRLVVDRIEAFAAWVRSEQRRRTVPR